MTFILKVSFAGYNLLGSHFLSLKILNLLLHFLWTKYHCQKSDDDGNLISLYRLLLRASTAHLSPSIC